MLKALFICFVIAACNSKTGSPGPTPPGGTAAHGTLAGKVNFIGGTPCPEDKCDHTGYEVVIYQADGKTVAGTTKTDADGKFTLDLPAGKYVIITQAGMMPDAKVRTDVTVSRDALSTVELRYDDGVR